jgi:hypothetical protein
MEYNMKIKSNLPLIANRLREQKSSKRVENNTKIFSKVLQTRQLHPNSYHKPISNL